MSPFQSPVPSPRLCTQHYRLLPICGCVWRSPQLDRFHSSTCTLLNPPANRTPFEAACHIQNIPSCNQVKNLYEIVPFACPDCTPLKPSSSAPLPQVVEEAPEARKSWVSWARMKRAGQERDLEMHNYGRTPIPNPKARNRTPREIACRKRYFERQIEAQGKERKREMKREKPGVRDAWSVNPDGWMGKV